MKLSYQLLDEAFGKSLNRSGWLRLAPPSKFATCLTLAALLLTAASVLIPVRSTDAASGATTAQNSDMDLDCDFVFSRLYQIERSIRADAGDHIQMIRTFSSGTKLLRYKNNGISAEYLFHEIHKTRVTEIVVHEFYLDKNLFSWVGSPKTDRAAVAKRFGFRGTELPGRAEIGCENYSVELVFDKDALDHIEGRLMDVQ